jgi:hypothetical protein
LMMACGTGLHILSLLMPHSWHNAQVPIPARFYRIQFNSSWLST